MLGAFSLSSINLRKSDRHMTSIRIDMYLLNFSRSESEKPHYRNHRSKNDNEGQICLGKCNHVG